MSVCRVFVGGERQYCGAPATVLIDDLMTHELVPVCAEHDAEIKAPRDWQWEAAEYERMAARLADGPPADRRAAKYWRERARMAREEQR